MSCEGPVMHVERGLSPAAKNCRLVRPGRFRPTDPRQACKLAGCRAQSRGCPLCAFRPM